MNTQLKYVATRFEQFTDRCEEIARRNRPPGKNAANGWVRERMRDDDEIVRCGHAPTLPLDGDADALFDIYMMFYGRIRGAFISRPNYSAHWLTHISVSLPALKRLVGIVASILELATSDEEERERIAAELAQRITETYNEVRESGNVMSGGHANGWISVDVKDASSDIKKKLVKLKRTASRDAIKIADVILEACKRLERLPVDNHKPWLRAEWQLGFQAIMDATTVTLRKIKQS